MLRDQLVLCLPANCGLLSGGLLLDGGANGVVGGHVVGLPSPLVEGEVDPTLGSTVASDATDGAGDSGEVREDRVDDRFCFIVEGGESFPVARLGAEDEVAELLACDNGRFLGYRAVVPLLVLLLLGGRWLSRWGLSRWLSRWLADGQLCVAHLSVALAADLGALAGGRVAVSGCGVVAGPVHVVVSATIVEGEVLNLVAELLLATVHLGERVLNSIIV